MNFLEFYKTLTLKEIRRRQDLTSAQIKLAFEQKNNKALENLREMENALTEALLERC